MRFALIIFILLTLPLPYASAQDADTTLIEQIDSIAAAAEEDVIYHALPDSSEVTQRAFSEQRVNELKTDPLLAYKRPASVGETLLERIWRWINYWFSELFSRAFEANWGRMIMYVIALGVVVILILTLMKVDAFRMLYAGTSNTVKYAVLDENIHEMNFDHLIRDAAAEKDFKKAIRLVFLYSLKLLSDKDHIHWESGKTNHDYVAELRPTDLRQSLNELSFYFDYAWYGNFSVNEQTYARVQEAFAGLKTKL